MGTVASIRPPKGMIPATEAYTANRTIMLPDIKLFEVKPHQVCVPLRGYAYTLGVCHKMTVNGRVLWAGWILAEDLGHKTVKQWKRATNWVDGGY